MLPVLRSGTTFSPLNELLTLRREMDQLFDRFFPWRTTTPDNAVVWTPPVTVREEPDALYVECELPGVSPEDVQLSIENGVLTIAGEKKAPATAAGQETVYHLLERRYGRFERSFNLPANVDAEKIHARYENGVLSIVLPKTEAAKPRRIQIEAVGASRK